MIISLKEFIRNGQFGPIEIGESKHAIVGALGEPDSDNDMGENGCILRYGWYELFIDSKDSLYAIQNDNYDSGLPETYEFRNEKVEIDSWFMNFTQGQDIESISKQIRNEDITVEEVEYYGRVVLRAQSGLIIDFTEEENECGKRELLGFRFWPAASIA